MTADECILTVPLILLRHMEISGLDVDKWFTIRNVYYGRAHKIFMQFSRRWWADDYAITHGVTVTDLAIRNVVYTPAGQDPSIDKGVIIASFAWEQDSMAYSMLDESQRIAQALQDLAKIHPEATETFEFGISQDWALDRHGGGIGPLFRPLEMTSRFTTTSCARSAGCGSPMTLPAGSPAAGSRAPSSRRSPTPTPSTPGCAMRSRRPPRRSPPERLPRS